MNQVDIETFLVLVRTKNITKTAESLSVSQPTISHRLKALEDELHVPLLIRRKGYKKVAITPQGMEFIPIAQRWLSLMRETMMLQNEVEERFLSVACTDTLNCCIMRDIYRKIRQETEYRLKLRLSTHYSYEIYDLLENRTVDVGFVYHQQSYRDILSEPVLKEKMYLVQAAEGAIPKPKINTDELNPEKEIYFVWEANYEIWHNEVVSHGKRPPLEVDSYPLLEESLLDAESWAIVPVTVVNELNKRENIRISAIGNRRKPPERTTYLVHSRELGEEKLATLQVLRRNIEEFYQANGLDQYDKRINMTPDEPQALGSGSFH